MKTSHSIRRAIRNRNIVLCVMLAAVVVLEFLVGEALAVHVGRVTAVYTDAVPAPNLSLGDALAALR